jgi:uncharacterized protein
MTKQEFIASKVSAKNNQIDSILHLLEADNTIPFIARYRKDKTQNADEVLIKDVQDLSQSYDGLIKRKQSILEKLHSVENISSDLIEKIENCFDEKTLERLFEPFKSSKNNILEKAIKHGYEKYAKMLMSKSSIYPEEIAQKLVNPDFPKKEDVLQGLQAIAENFIVQNTLEWATEKVLKQAFIKSAAKKDAEEEKLAKYSSYIDFNKRLQYISSHQFLALERAKEEKLLQVKLDWESKDLKDFLLDRYVKDGVAQEEWQEELVKHCFSKKIKPKIDRDVWKLTKEKAENEATKVFSKNLEQLLLSPPLGSKRILGIDPGFRTGCKMVCIDKNGDLKFNETIYPFHSDMTKKKMAGKKLRHAIEVFDIEAIAVGNGTAGKETYDFVKQQSVYQKIPVFLVEEAGASVYSASSVARAEFPNYDITVRGAVSIARRLMDPMAELIKIDPKSIGIGQYQHSVNQKYLEQELNHCIEKTVNKVGVNLNTASEYLLKYIAGLNEKLAKNIITKRSELGKFTNRNQLMQVKGLGAKTFEQSAAFLKIFGGDNYLDGTFIHPENYSVLKNVFGTTNRESMVEIGTKEYEDFKNSGIGELTFNDIKEAILKPNLSIRKRLGTATLDNNLKDINDLFVGQKLQGQVKNITNFGCFVDLGIKQNGLLHVSKMAKRFVSDVHEIVSLNQMLEVTVISVDLDGKKIGLSIIED